MSVIDVGAYAKRKPREKPPPETEPEPYEQRRWVSGVAQPLQAEIAEGKALREYLLDPENRRLKEVHRMAWNEMQKIPDFRMTLTRCSLCHTQRPYRRGSEPCLVCGCKSFY